MSPGYILGIGSNLEPEKHAALILEQLLACFGDLLVSRIYYTAPEAVASPQDFVNFCVFVPTELDAAAFKSACVVIEERLGRDRGNPLRKILDRPADLDVLARLSGRETGLEAASLCSAVYLAQPLAELLAQLGFATMPVAAGRPCPIVLDDQCLGEAPAAIHRDDRAGLVVVRQD
ncbi:MAG: 2-amino-4-hydroxy-6-hydroxymethyldihydropteridine diphosphokinase [Gammaproteobacteria bacterium]|nr:2-amino-4-hydroxy-6-hydroxymethyldihydropteridine diphosphokinase [Gammaproteobacteria bacterium]